MQMGKWLKVTRFIQCEWFIEHLCISYFYNNMLWYIVKMKATLALCKIRKVGVANDNIWHLTN